MRQPTRLVRDATDRYKLKVSLSGGRYQLSLDDEAVNVLVDDLGLSERDTVPDPVVPFFVAVGDAWFPRQRDADAVIEDIPATGTLTADERTALVSYLTSRWIPERNEQRVLEVLSNSPIADAVDPGELQIRTLPDPTDIFESRETLAETADTDTTPVESTDSQFDAPIDPDRVMDSQADASTDPVAASPGEQQELQQESKTALQKIPGIGSHRAEKLVSGGLRSVSMVASSRPVELAEINGISRDMAAVAVEGARELVGETTPADQRLSAQTGVSQRTFDAALSSLAASGVPSSEAVPTLRVLYGPTVADLEAVSGQQAYYLWEAGYQTPQDIIEASADELTGVYQVGSHSAPRIKESAQDFVDSL